MSLRSVLLVLLSREPNTGYGVGRLLNRECRHLWDARLQQIYGEFAKLQAEGLVDVESIAMPNRPAKKVYSLTAEGTLALDSCLAQPPSCHAAKDELLIQLFCLERMPQAVVVRRLEQRRDEFAARVSALRDLILYSPRIDPSRLGQLLTLEAALAHAAAEVSWCEKALAVLRNERQSADARDGEQAGGLRLAQA